ncbi:Type 1 glutamine amidotransferase-like domain-containing protein [Paenibacillus sp. UNC451MF]|uniref:Type 1 glutamine amidotransferase-like domain-containing protein n=1 Tax=Paenibacillus sp. UNC451MF TaxID=1449063 RepID=UPI00048DF54E|nr:Type 1 glutamine amidotransferase-like domain-containing protein [Paenibacillus sp. UNC451MF]
MKLLLTSDGISSSAIEEQILAMLDSPPAKLKSCIITTASSKKHKSQTALSDQVCLRRLGVACCDLLDIEFDDPHVLSNYDVIHLNGGNPFYLMLQMKRRNAVELMRQLAQQHRLIIGVSAGAMVLADTLEHVNELNQIIGYENMDLEELTDYSGIGLTPLAIVPHYNRFIADNHDFEQKLQQLELSKNRRYERIKDGEALIIQGDTMSYVSSG